MNGFEKYKFIIGCIGTFVVIIVLLFIAAGVNELIDLMNSSYDQLMNSVSY